VSAPMSLPSRWKATRYELKSPPTGETFNFVASARTAPDGCFRFVWTLAPGKRGPGEHYHPTETETFEIISGTLRIWQNGIPKDYGPGEIVAVLPRVVHKFLNPTSEPCVMNVKLDGPALEDAFLPIAVATHGRKPKMSELARFILNTDEGGSVPTMAIVKPIGWVITTLLRLFGVKKYEPVLGWDKAE
jgi:quercetin dioxygenase-like cupin family protein